MRHVFLAVFVAFICLIGPAFVLPPSRPAAPATHQGRLTVIFETGFERDYGPVSLLSTDRDVVTFTDKQGRDFVFLKSRISGWAVSQ